MKDKHTSVHKIVYYIGIIIYNKYINRFKPSLYVTDNISVTEHFSSMNLVIYIIRQATGVDARASRVK